MIIDELVECNPINLDLARNKIVVNVLAYDPVNVVNRTGLEYYLEVWVPVSYNANTFKLLGTLEAREEPKHVSGTVEYYPGAFFEISSLLDAMLETTKPAFRQSQISVCKDMVTPYYCVVKILNNGVLVDTYTSPSRYAIKSGISETDFEFFQNNFFSTYIGSSGKFLSYKTTTNLVLQAGKTEFLYFLTNYDVSITTLKLKVVCQLADGSETINIQQILEGVLPMNVYCIPLKIEDSNVLSCSVWLLNQNDLRISEVVSYKIEQRYRRFAKRILFENSLGVFDTFTFFGQSAENLSFSRQVGEQFVGYDYLAEASESVIRSTKATRKLSIAIEWAYKNVAEYLTDLFFSKKCYLETDRSYLPLLPISDGYIPSDDSEEWAGRQIEFLFGKEETNYSNLPTPTAIESRPTGWRPLSTACELDANGKYNGMMKVVTIERIYLDDNSLVTPRQIKPNVVGEEGYIASIASASCAATNTPFLSAAISRQGTFINMECGTNMTGGYATITIPAGTWGSLLSQADANAKAEADWQSKNTQAYANANGTCSNYPQNYAVAGGVPANKFWVRLQTNSISITSGSGISQASENLPRPGNMWFNQPQFQTNQTNVYPQNSWDVSFPSGTAYLFHLYLNNNNNTPRTWKYYINGVLIQTLVTGSWYTQILLNQQPQSGDRVYFSIN